MKKLISLFKILLNSTYGISVLKYKVSKNKMEILKTLGIIAVIAAGIAPIFIMYSFFMFNSYLIYRQIGQPGVIITMGVVFSSLLVLFFGFFLVVSTFYFSTDTEHLITLPLRPFDILGAKFGVVLVGEYITEIPIMLPPVLIFGIGSRAGVLYWIYALIGILIIPVIPLCIVSILALIIMRVTNIGKKKDLLRIIGSVLAIFLILGIQMYIQGTTASKGIEGLNNMLLSENGIVTMLSRNYLPAAWLSFGLIKYNSINGFINFMLFAGLSIGLLIVFGFFAQKFFLGGYVGSSEANASRKSLNEGELEKKVHERSRIMAIFWREFIMMIKIPPYFINCILTVVLVPAIFFMMFFMTGDEVSKELGITFADPKTLYAATLIISGIGILISSFNMIAPTSISREGELFFISKYIPVTPKEQLLGKFIQAFVVGAAGTILTVGTIGFLAGIPAVNIIIAIIIGISASVPILAIGFMIDLFRPVLHWDNPQKAVKNNLNGVISMFFNMIWPIVVMLPVGVIISNPALSYLIIIAVFLLLGFILYKLLMIYGEKRYMEIEV